MKFAYLILVHQQPQHFLRLVKKLDSPNAVFIVHVDAKADITEFKKIENEIDSKKIIWLERRSIVWAGFNIVRVTLDGLKAAAASGWLISHVSCISGQDYLIKPVAQYEQFLQAAGETSFLQHSPMPRPGWPNGGMDRIGYYHLVLPVGRLVFPPLSYLKVKLAYTHHPKWVYLKKLVKVLPAAKKFPRSFVKNAHPFEGSNWFTLSMPLIKDLLQLLENDNSFYNYYRFTHVADEMFFQTVICNRLTQHAAKIKNHNLTHIVWNNKTGRPYNLTLNNLEELRQSDSFFARKFDAEQSEALLATIDNELLAAPQKKPGEAIYFNQKKHG